MSIRRRILVVSYLAVLCAPVAAKLAHAPEHPLEGALAPAPRVSLTVEGVRTEQFQTKTTAWFEASLGLHSWFVWLDNSLQYHLFHETKWGSHVEIGKGRVLFERDDIEYFNRFGSALPLPGAVDSFADAILALQRRMQRDHRALVPIILPSKTTFYRDAVPDTWTRDLGEPRPAVVAVYQKMKAALEHRGVLYVDGIELLAASAQPREILWGRDARHFSAVAGCECMAKVIPIFAALTGRPQVDSPCTPSRIVARRNHSDLDLFRLLNAWGAGRTRHVYQVDHAARARPAAPPSALWISTSFGWLLEIDAVQSGLFGEIHLASYNYALYQDGVEGWVPVQQHTAAWKKLFLTRDLIVLELHESYLTPGKFFGENAVRAMLEDLGP